MENEICPVCFAELPARGHPGCGDPDCPFRKQDKGNPWSWVVFIVFSVILALGVPLVLLSAFKYTGIVLF